MWTQAKVIAAAVLLIVTFAGGWYFGALSGRLGKANAEQKALSERLQMVLDGQQEATRRAEKLQKTLDRLPKSEGKVREVVRQNPAKCDRPVVVAERVREAAREANRAREMPSDF
jgi:hypothetical protein